MKKKLLLLTLFLTITIVKAQDAVNDTFVIGDFTYEITSLTPNEVEVHDFAEVATITTAVEIPSSVDSPNTNTYSVTKIGAYAFQNSDMISVIIPTSVTSIGQRGFLRADSLTSVTLPSSITSLDVQGTFRDCENLQTLDLSAISITDIPNNMVLDCANLTSVLLPTGLLNFGANSFKNTTSLASITFPNTVVLFKNTAFMNSGLTSVTFPNSVTSTSFNQRAFLNCKSLVTITFPLGITAIGDQTSGKYETFKGASVLTTVVNFGDVQTVGNGVFQTSPLLSSIDISGMTYINANSFNGCTALTSVTLNSNLTGIAKQAFMASGLTTIELPSSITSMTENPFKDCVSLTSVKVNNTTPLVIDDIFSGTTDTANATLYVPAGKTSDYKAAAEWSTFGTFSERTITWDGSTGTNWADLTNWSNYDNTSDATSLPTAASVVEIPSDLTNYPITGANVTVNSATIESGASLIATGFTFAGNVTYQVNANDTNWHLISSPVEAAAYNGIWVNDNDIDNSTRTEGTNVAIGTYINTTDVDGDWTYATDAAETGTFATAQGHSIKRDATTNAYISFTGTVKTDNLTSSITQNSSNWNLKGNPYPSYILVSDILDDNTSNLTSTHKNVYVWDNNKSGGAGYDALETTDYIHPGQGFFVNAANSTADNFTIDASKLSHQSANNTLYKSEANTSVTLLIKDGKNVKSTKINYLADKTKGLDPSFDVGTFTGEATSFDVFTQLVSNNKGVNFLRQALPNSDLEAMIVPVGLKAAANKEIIFSAEALNLPSDLKVFLEDRLTNTFTRLDEANSSYKITLSEALNGVGRFYIHTSSKSTLSVDAALTFENVSIYTTDNSTLRIVGLSQGKTSFKLFNVLGKQMMNTSFESNGVKDISLSKLATGLYIVQIESETGKLNKKIILE